jgi:hypothetical protein
MNRSVFQNLLLLTGSFLLCLLAGEVAIRFLGVYDLDGNFILHGRTLKPFRLPAQTTRLKAEEYRTATGTRTIYDGHLGWGYRPEHKSSDGLYAYNSLGARTGSTAPVEYSKAPRPGMLRIVLVGDSYTHGDEVPFENTWGYYLEKRLNESGIEAEVINLAVGSYGMDQAFLRWQRLGANLSPHMVILGLQMENVQRNVNIIKPLYQPNTGLPFSKPRFLLNGDGLRLINEPSFPAEQVAEVLEDTRSWELVSHEQFLRPEYYESRVVLKSKLIALIQEIVRPIEAEPYFYDVRQEPAKLALRIIKAFKGDVEANGGSFLIVQIPIVLDLVKLRLGLELTYAGLLAEIEAAGGLIHTQDRLLDSAGWASWPSLFMPGGHYSARGNQLIADAVAERVILTQARIAAMPFIREATELEGVEWRDEAP